MLFYREADLQNCSLVAARAWVWLSGTGIICSVRLDYVSASGSELLVGRTNRQRHQYVSHSRLPSAVIFLKNSPTASSTDASCSLSFLSTLTKSAHHSDAVTLGREGRARSFISVNTEIIPPSPPKTPSQHWFSGQTRCFR